MCGASSKCPGGVGEGQVFQKMHGKKLEKRTGPTHDTKFWYVVQIARFFIVLAVGEVPRRARRSNLDSMCKVMQIDALNLSIRTNPMLSHLPRAVNRQPWFPRGGLVEPVDHRTRHNLPRTCAQTCHDTIPDARHKSPHVGNIPKNPAWPNYIQPKTKPQIST